MRALLEEMEGFTVSETNLIVSIMLFTSALSLFGSVFIIVNYIVIKSLRHQLSYKLILWVAVSDAIYSIANLLSFEDTENNTALCVLQGMGTQFGGVASIFWVIAISWTINHLIHSPKNLTKGELKRILLIMHTVIWSLSFLMTILPLITDTIGPSGGLYT